MTKLQPTAWRFKGVVTVFASLVFLLVMSLVAALITSANVQVKKSTLRANMNMALENIFAEYDQKLLDQYEIFARADSDESVVKNRLQFYGIVDGSHILTKCEFLTDKKGLPFYQGAVRYMKNLLGLDETISGGNLSPFEGDESMKILGNQASETLSELLAQDENTLLEEGNPLGNIQNLKNSSLISILVTNEENISHRSIDLSDVVSKRNLNKGYGVFENVEGEGGFAEKFLFVEYLFSHFSDAAEERNLNALSYELEYVLCGKSVDKENLEEVLKKILSLRIGVNYAYLLTDEVKKTEAEMMAAGLCALMTVPGVTAAVKQAILLAWAYGESIVDLRVLMKQKKVPIVKTSSTWQLQLSNLIKLGTSEEIAGEKAADHGLSYVDYLKGLLLLEDRETLSMRSLDLIEKNLSIKADQCMTKAEVQTKRHLWRSVSDTFDTEYQYQ